MSVQAGIWNFNGEPINHDYLARISQRLTAYGPDGESSYLDGSIGILYRPYHTTPESHLEQQPHVSGNGRVITFDGRLDNRDELMPQLRDELAADQTDVAIVAAAFVRWDTDCFRRLTGDWAMAVWNRQDNELILARDYVGVRHLFYYKKTKTVIWCTHLEPLVLFGDCLTLCNEYVAGYLAFHPDAHLTPYREIQSVPPGKFIRIHDLQTSAQTHWAFNFRIKTRYKTDAEYEEQFRYLVRRAVRRRLRADGPVLAELSGGLDSSSVVCIADDILRKEGAEASRVDTFSYYDSNEPNEDDLIHLARVEEKRGQRGIRVDLKGSGASLSLAYPSFVAVPGFGHRAEIDTALFELVHSQKYRVVLSGTGGDEMNGQPLDPCVQMADLFLQFRLREVTNQLVAWSLILRTPLVQLFLQTLIQFLPVSFRGRFTRQGQPDSWVDPTFARQYRLSERQLEATEGPWFSRPSVRDATQTINTLAQLMTYSRPFSLETRYPYLDQNLVEFLTSIPLEQILRPGQRRFLMRRALAGILPPEILARKTKAGASRCYSVALEKNWDAIDGLFQSPLTGDFGYIDRRQIRSVLRTMKNGQVPTYFLRLLKAVSLELWLRQVVIHGIITVPVFGVATETVPAQSHT
jgi:asparagine synthase (glutamine-hydrolysing)